MKKRLILFAIALVAFLVTGCRNENSANTATNTATDTSTPAANDGTTATSTTSMTSGSVASSTATIGTPLSDPDHKYADRFGEGDASEVAVGKIAESKATDPDVKAFAQKLVTDHTNALNELEQIARTKNVTLPTELDKEHRDFEAKLNALSGVAFDREFVADMVKDHDTDIKDFEKAQKEVKDGDLSGWVNKTLPTIREHDKVAHDLQKKLGGAMKKGGVAF